MNQMTSKFSSGDAHVYGNIHQSYHQSRHNQYSFRSMNNFNDHRHYDNRRTNYYYNCNQRQSSQRAVNYNDSNRDYLKGDQILKWFTDKSIS